MKPIVVFFLVFLLFYGLYHTLIMVFYPILTSIPSKLFFAAGVDEYILATLWTQYHATSLSDLYEIIVQLTETSNIRPISLLDSVRCYIQFDLLCCIVFSFFLVIKRRKICLNTKILLRLLLFALILLLFLGLVLLTEIYTQNEEISHMCTQAYAMLDQSDRYSSDLMEDETFQHCLQSIQQYKEHASRELFYGAYGISDRYFGPWRFIEYIWQELCRVFRQ